MKKMDFLKTPLNSPLQKLITQIKDKDVETLCAINKLGVSDVYSYS